ncbi:MAG: ATP-binding protein [Granulosicoccus sp.]
MHFTLQQLGLIDAPSESEYDNLTSLAAQLLQVPVAHVSILDKEKKRVVYKSQHGHPDELADARELPMEMTYCQHVALTQAPVIVVDASDHPLLNGTPAQSEGQPLAYLGVPVVAPDGYVVGGLCMMQPETRQWTDTEINSAKKLAACVSDLIRLKAAMLTSERLRTEQREFTYAISHDLKSPANTLQMILDELTIEGDRLSDDARMLVKEGLGTVESMKQQVEDVLDYSRTVEAADTTEIVSTGELLEEILHEMKSDIESSQACVTCTELPDIKGHRMQLKALFQNLISNALKYRTTERSPVVSVAATLDESSGTQSVMVKDNGIGIAEKNQVSIFGLFNRLHLKDQYAGTGIGLALCHRVMENHDGTINVTSDGQNGSIFTVQFPGNHS